MDDGSHTIFLNTRGTVGDISDAMKEFLAYVENSSDEFAAAAGSEWVKQLHCRMKKVKESKELEAEYMKSYLTYLENVEEGEKRATEQWKTIVSEKDSQLHEKDKQLHELTARLDDLTILVTDLKAQLTAPRPGGNPQRGARCPHHAAFRGNLHRRARCPHRAVSRGKPVGRRVPVIPA